MILGHVDESALCMWNPLEHGRGVPVSTISQLKCTSGTIWIHTMDTFTVFTSAQPVGPTQNGPVSVSVRQNSVSCSRPAPDPRTHTAHAAKTSWSSLRRSCLYAPAVRCAVLRSALFSCCKFTAAACAERCPVRHGRRNGSDVWSDAQQS